MSAATLFETLKKDFGKNDTQKCITTLTQLKVALITSDSEPIVHRETLEIGAQVAIKCGDIPSFERYFEQLKHYYFDHTSLPHSQRMFPILGLNLLRLLAQNKISEFHTMLEAMQLDQLSNIYIKHPIQVEQCLMEGSYSKVWNSRNNVPAEEYVFFMDILMSTIRSEIASCSEKAYYSLPITDAATLLYFKSPEEVVNFAKERSWKINANDNKIYFDGDMDESTHIPTAKMINLAIGYARELERIV